MSNFLGEVRVVPPKTFLLSMRELTEREGFIPQKGMNFREAVFLVLPSHEGEYKDEWDAKMGLYTFEGHDSTTVEAGGKSKDQLLMYADGKVSDNGKFYKAATDFTDGVRDEPMQIHVYEKLDPAVFFDKGFFNLVGARRVKEKSEKEERTIFKFDLTPIVAGFAPVDAERMLPAALKAHIWQTEGGRCSECSAQANLRFHAPSFHLVCAQCRGEGGGMLG